jgi:hypothetical protein
VVIWRTDAALCLCFWHRAWACLLGIFACIGHGQSDRRGFFSIFCHAAIYSWIGGGSCGPSGARLVHPAYRVPDIGGGEGYAIVMICDRRFWWGETRGRDTGHGHLKREKGRTHIFLYMLPGWRAMSLGSVSFSFHMLGAERVWTLIWLMH